MPDSTLHAPWKWLAWPFLSHAFALLFVFVLTAEVVARVDDFFRYGVSVGSTPDRDADLVLRDEMGIRGKPGGRYQKWQLNAFGFRGPEIRETPDPACPRIMTLGASETFGLYESPGREYPAQLRARLAISGCTEVINASLYGFTLPVMRQYWNNWAARFKPAVVFVYPTPAFYLAESPPAVPAGAGSAPMRPPWWNPRLVGRAFDLIEMPAFIQRRRIARLLDQVDASHEPAWFYTDVPADRVALFRQDLELLVNDISATGARVVLITHATGFSVPLDDKERDAMSAWRRIVARPTDEVLLEFESAARAVTVETGTRLGVDVLDLAGRLGGDRSAFASDFLHFNDEGARRVAELIASALPVSSPSTRPGTREAGKTPAQ